ncbi:hypothetical protein [Companilactobacillus jidongensis]|uniref:hypothetical protein n=1 Tax=Companilactobacillus jidongensis TaxID=2486006 RepID=UPI000F785194|nr:hypothetical protein [Companilactobacillus jidongensis]
MSIKLQKYNKKIITQNMIEGYDSSVNDNIGVPNSVIERSNHNSNMQPVVYGGNYETDIL